MERREENNNREACQPTAPGTMWIFVSAMREEEMLEETSLKRREISIVLDGATPPSMP